MGRRSIASGLVIALLLFASASVAAYPRPHASERVSVTRDGGPTEHAKGGSSSISASGRYVAFDHIAADLVEADTNLMSDVFIRDTRTDETILVSRTPAGTVPVGTGRPAPGAPNDDDPDLHIVLNLSFDPSISASGRFVAFSSFATNLVPGDVNGVADIFIFDRRTSSVRLVSEGLDGKPSLALNGSFLPSISADGRFVSFTSDATNLVEGDENGAPDVFVTDTRKETTVRVSVAPDGSESSPCEGALPTDCAQGILTPITDFPTSSINATGRFVVFDSRAADLVEGDTNLVWDVFVRDLKKNSTTRVSVATGGEEAKTWMPPGTAARWGSSLVGKITGPTPPTARAISGDGRFVTFSSNAYNLVPNDTTQDPRVAAVPAGGVTGMDVFVRDMKSRRTTRLSVEPDGRQWEEINVTGGAGSAYSASISADGRQVVFNANPTGGTESAYFGHIDEQGRRTGGGVAVHHIPSGAITPSPVQRTTCGVCNERGDVLWGPQHEYADIDADGRYISYTDTYLYRPLPAVPPAPAAAFFTWDRGPDVGVGALSGSPPGPPKEPEPLCITPDLCIPPLGAAGARDGVSDVNPMLTRAGANLYGAAIAYRPQYEDLLLTIELQDMPSLRTSAGGAATEGNPALVHGARFAVGPRTYEVRASSLKGGRFGLFDCTEKFTCISIADLNGGYGTTGERIVVSVPLDDIDFAQGRTLSEGSVFSAIGSLATGRAKVLDSMRLEAMKLTTGD